MASNITSEQEAEAKIRNDWEDNNGQGWRDQQHKQRSIICCKCGVSALSESVLKV